ncbi:flagellar biosynthetic protein FlhB [Photobacterium jeanii]|uniref:Flagellar biosynthetic protein FlhB n=1 Tax=Photobacterium jeanii TaxID=858640 RepID=A0A178KHU8_9GAMM|nr:flagellar biosynthesis protein FlhB [Photobacterium jeanii]OAN16696.1 flagellar biosynthetic protein FlhB [Photobacterium jeanii]PST87425.1 flagellar biosynthesis protein FlhB [Photobacterium jeanii]
MSNDSSQDKTEQPSQQKLRKAREDGNLPRSKELVTAMMILGSALLLTSFGGTLAEMFRQVSRLNMALPKAAAFDSHLMLNHLSESLWLMVAAIGPMLGLLVVVTILANLLRGGWNLSSKAAQPKFSKLNPISGVKRMFSTKSLVELLKSILKVTLIVATLVMLIRHTLNDIVNLQRLSLEQAMLQAVDFLWLGLFSFGLALLFIAVLELPYSSWDYTKQLKMTKQEVKEESKNSEGRPEVKARIRQLQRQMSQRSLTQTIPQADVVITNPTHYAVALKYDLSKAGAPFVIAKGVDQMALQMQQVARRFECPVVEVPPLTRAVYYSTNEWQEVPAPLYVAVAHILTFVFQMKEYQHGRQSSKPEFPRISIPRELRR